VSNKLTCRNFFRRPRQKTTTQRKKTAECLRAFNLCTLNVRTEVRIKFERTFDSNHFCEQKMFLKRQKVKNGKICFNSFLHFVLKGKRITCYALVINAEKTHLKHHLYIFNMMITRNQKETKQLKCVEC
jgi:hypothetical protein